MNRKKLIVETLISLVSLLALVYFTYGSFIISTIDLFDASQNYTDNTLWRNTTEGAWCGASGDSSFVRQNPNAVYGSLSGAAILQSVCNNVTASAKSPAWMSSIINLTNNGADHNITINLSYSITNNPGEYAIAICVRNLTTPDNFTNSNWQLPEIDGCGGGVAGDNNGVILLNFENRTQPSQSLNGSINASIYYNNTNGKFDLYTNGVLNNSVTFNNSKLYISFFAYSANNANTTIYIWSYADYRLLNVVNVTSVVSNESVVESGRYHTLNFSINNASAMDSVVVQAMNSTLNFTTTYRFANDDWFNASVNTTAMRVETFQIYANDSAGVINNTARTTLFVNKTNASINSMTMQGTGFGLTFRCDTNVTHPKGRVITSVLTNLTHNNGTALISSVNGTAFVGTPSTSELWTGATYTIPNTTAFVGNYTCRSTVIDDAVYVSEKTTAFEIKMNTTPTTKINQPLAIVTTLGNITGNMTFNMTPSDGIGACWWNLTTSTGQLVGNAFNNITCGQGIQFSFNVSTDGNYIIYAHANSSTNVYNGTTSFPFFVNSGGGGGGGGGNTFSLLAIGIACTQNSQCFSNVCDIGNTNLCVLSLCGNGKIDINETRSNCPLDYSPNQQQILNIFGGNKPLANASLKYGFFILLSGGFLAVYQPWKKIKLGKLNRKKEYAN